MDGVPLFQSLADDTRLRIVNLLTHGEMNVSEIVHVLDCLQSKISRHLTYLKRSGLVHDRKFQNQVLYSINTHDQMIKEHLIPLVHYFISKEPGYTEDLSKLQHLYLEHKQERPKDWCGKRVLVICEHNSSRSQMAQAFFNHLGHHCIDAYSAGLSPSGINRDIIKVMKEKGYDISHQRSQSLLDYIERKDPFDVVITVCDESLLNQCPLFPGEIKRLHWNLEDPSKYFTKDQSGIKKIRQICNQIEKHVKEFISEEC